MLLHGSVSSSNGNWIRGGVTDAFARAGYQLIAYDARGHGKSDKPHDPDAYRGGAMIKDARSLMDFLGLEACHLVGYSMGARVSLGIAAVEPRVRSVIAGGIGIRSYRQMAAPRTAISQAMLAESVEAVSDLFARGFRAFAERTGADRKALAAVFEAGFGVPDLSKIKVPVLFICGREDLLAGDPAELSAEVPDARVEMVAGEHLTALGDPRYVPAMLEFLEEQQGTAPAP